MTKPVRPSIWCARHRMPNADLDEPRAVGAIRMMNPIQKVLRAVGTLSDPDRFGQRMAFALER